MFVFLAPTKPKAGSFLPARKPLSLNMPGSRGRGSFTRFEKPPQAPFPSPNGGRPRVSDRACLTALSYLLREGCTYRDQTEETLQWSSRTCSEYVATGANYFVCSFQWGDISHADAMRSIELFATEVMPRYASAAGWLLPQSRVT